MSKNVKLGSYFIQNTLNNGEKFVMLVDFAPEWLCGAVHDAHQSDLPNDWIYNECYAACLAIDDGSLSNQDSIHQHADSQMDVYTKDLYQWAADMCLTAIFSHAEEEADDFGPDDAPGSTIDRLTRVQYCAIARIAQTIWDAYETATAE